MTDATNSTMTMEDMMRRRLGGMVAVALVATALVTVRAQAVPEVKLPPSPQGQASVQVGGRWEKTDSGGQRYVDGKWIVVDYGRPLLRGRAGIFGSGADYGKTISDGVSVWRMGANDTTRLTTQVPLAIGGKTLAPGVYNAFAELKNGAWTLVLSTQARQPSDDPNDKVLLYGSYNYDPKFDVLRAPMTVRQGDPTVEQLTIGFVNVTATSATLSVAWEKTVATIDLKVAAK
ncbi:MAG: DUF2911 domain-containing protein [Vicinamibacterales bacterium]